MITELLLQEVTVKNELIKKTYRKQDYDAISSGSCSVHICIAMLARSRDSFIPALLIIIKSFTQIVTY